MPIYEYQTSNPESACAHCRHGFETIQKINEMPLSICPRCGGGIKKIISWCRSAVVEQSQEDTSVNKKLSDYERSGMWSHAAELADTHSEKIKNKELKARALENYKKAGYDADSLEKHVTINKD